MIAANFIVSSAKITQDGFISREQYVVGMSIFLFGTEKELIGNE